MKRNDTFAKQTTRHIPSLTGRSYGRKIFRPYQHFVPDGTINATTLSRQGQNVGRKPYQTQITVPSGTECKGEWCQDRYGEYSALSQQDPVGASKGSLRVVRGGGSWSDKVVNYRVVYRFNVDPGNPDLILGFCMVLP